jgi:hypothetical protein
MTEAEWLAQNSPLPLFHYLFDRPTEKDRKLRLFGCACCRHIWPLLTDERSRRVVEVSELYADGLATEAELRRALSSAHLLVQDETVTRIDRTSAAYLAARTAETTGWWHTDYGLAGEVVRFAQMAVASSRSESVTADDPLGAIHAAEATFQASAFRDIFGNPWRQVLVDPSWLSWGGGTVRTLSQTIYDERAFESLPVLADALEDAGCSDTAILGHCRGGGVHVRGCWVLDLLLGKGPLPLDRSLMSETEWLACNDPRTMLQFLRVGASERKLRLFLCACSRRLWELLTVPALRVGVEVAERYADGQAEESEREAAWERSRDAFWQAWGQFGNEPGEAPTDEQLAHHGSLARAHLSVYAPAPEGKLDYYDKKTVSQSWAERLDPEEERCRCDLLRDLFYPFRPVRIDSTWLSWRDSTIPKLAQVIYDERAFDRLPVLADALKDAGCADEDILKHCREPREHVRGCWVVDLLLGKE